MIAKISFIFVLLWTQYSPALYCQNSALKTVNPHITYGLDTYLVNIRDATLLNDKVYVLTGQEPYLKVFEKENFESWGREGKGPSELQRPIAIDLNQDGVYVLDAPPGACKVVKYSFSGEYLNSRVVQNIQMCYDLAVSSTNIILQSGKWGEQENHLIVLHEKPDTVISFNKPEAVRIEAEEGPMNSYSFVNPYAPKPQWTLNSEGDLIYWDGLKNTLSITNIKTSANSFFQISPIIINISTDDINYWIANEFSPDQELFGIQDPFRNIRDKIKVEVDFPEYYPLLSDIKTDPIGFIWILRASKLTGQIWTYYSPEGENATIEFPANRNVLEFGKKYILTKSKDESGVEYIELYPRQFLKSN